MSVRIEPSALVLRVTKLLPQVQVTWVTTYSGWMSAFTCSPRRSAVAGRTPRKERWARVAPSTRGGADERRARTGTAVVVGPGAPLPPGRRFLPLPVCQTCEQEPTARCSRLLAAVLAAAGAGDVLARVVAGARRGAGLGGRLPRAHRQLDHGPGGRVRVRRGAGLEQGEVAVVAVHRPGARAGDVPRVHPHLLAAGQGVGARAERVAVAALVLGLDGEHLLQHVLLEQLAVEQRPPEPVDVADRGDHLRGA